MCVHSDTRTILASCCGFFVFPVGLFLTSSKIFENNWRGMFSKLFPETDKAVSELSYSIIIVPGVFMEVYIGTDDEYCFVGSMVKSSNNMSRSLDETYSSTHSSIILVPVSVSEVPTGFRWTFAESDDAKLSEVKYGWRVQFLSGSNSVDIKNRSSIPHLR